MTAPPMRAVVCSGTGGPEVLAIGPAPRPVPGKNQLLVRVQACALNRADLLQCRGLYPPPAGESEILGLELAGEVVEVGAGVTTFTPGDRVFGLVGGGAYAEFALLDAEMALPMPAQWDFTTAAAVPEVFFTAFETLFTRGELVNGESVLIHAGASGVGTAAIQLARRAGASVYVTAGSDEKIARCCELGASGGVNYREMDFAEGVRALTDGTGVDLIEDFIGADYLERNLALLRPLGRLVMIAFMGGAKAEINLASILSRRLTVRGFVMRSQSLAEKREITGRFREQVLPDLVGGTLRPVIDSVYPVTEVGDAHRRMAANENIGKILLDCGRWD